MPDVNLKIETATDADIHGILELQHKNQPEQGGSLTGGFTREQLEIMLRNMPFIVAKSNGSIVGYLITSEVKSNGNAPVIEAMLKAYPGSTTAYVYGPVCVSSEARGKGIAQKLFAEVKRVLPGREGVLFIRKDNAASIQAHKKMGMDEVGAFEFNKSHFFVLSYMNKSYQ